MFKKRSAPDASISLRELVTIKYSHVDVDHSSVSSVEFKTRSAHAQLNKQAIKTSATLVVLMTSLGVWQI